MITMYITTEVVIMLLIILTCITTAIMLSTFFIWITLDLVYKIKDRIKERREK
jgi:accessory gene regulator protein AgrB